MHSGKEEGAYMEVNADAGEEESPYFEVQNDDE